jgi:hypothetical protein
LLLSFGETKERREKKQKKGGRKGGKKARKGNHSLVESFRQKPGNTMNKNPLFFLENQLQ